jgi:hypothetical protein
VQYSESFFFLRTQYSESLMILALFYLGET